MSKLYNLRGDKITGNSLELGTTSVKSLVIGEDCYINNGMLYIKTHLYDSTVELYFDEFSGIVNETTTIATVKGDKVTVKNNNSTATVNSAYDDTVEGYIGVCVVVLNEPYKLTQAIELQREQASVTYSNSDGMTISGNTTNIKFFNENLPVSTKAAIKIGANDSNSGSVKYLNSDTSDALILDVGGSEKIVCWKDRVDINGGYLNLASKTTNTISMEGANENCIRMTGSTNDHARIRMFSRDGSTNNGALEISTCDDSSEPIYFRQYQGNFNTITRELTLLDSTGNTYIPGTLFVKDQDILSDVNNLKALL